MLKAGISSIISHHSSYQIGLLLRFTGVERRKRKCSHTHRTRSVAKELILFAAFGTSG